ncbi:MAG TPA: iron ABC transporter permease [Thermoanaerobacterales bacterium]|jgi:iron complex transport system permease protein|nr:iron ABC transporter permease [Thermoanaerobacterales bacterium]
MQIDFGEKNTFKDEETRRLGVSKKNRSIVILAISLVLVYIYSVFFTVNLYGNNLSLAWYLQIVSRKIQDFSNFILSRGATNGIHFTIFRHMIVVLVGAALAGCGAVYQGLFRNAMAGPSTLGVQAGGLLGGMLYVYFFTDSSSISIKYSELQAAYQEMDVFHRNMQGICILVGCFVGIILVAGISKMASRGKLSTLPLILTGFLFSSLINSVAGLMQYYMVLTNPGDLRSNAMRSLMMGTFDNTFTLEHLLLVGMPILVCLSVLLSLRSKINVLVFGDDEALSMGMRVNLFHNILLTVCTIMVAVTISFCGQIGFIGLIIPHIGRLLVGPDYRVLLPTSMILGGIVMLLVYSFAISVGYGSNINLATSLISGTLFIIFLITYRRKRNADWA